jgi:hypothetical protein
MITDMIDQEIKIDDWVVFYSNIYRVTGLGREYPKDSGRGAVKIKIWNGGKTSRSVQKHCKDVVVLDRNYILIWLLKQSEL